jgi:hypothetical protein
MEKNINIGMLTMNDKIVTINNSGVKRHIGNIKSVKLNMKIFFFQAIKDIKTLKIETLDIMLEDIEKYIGNVTGFRVENIL